MIVRIMELLLLVFSLYGFCTAVGTSDKLDFDGSSHSVSLRNVEKPLTTKVIRTVETVASPSEQISISCGATGCNTTNNNSSFQTEILVHVQTKVNLDKSDRGKVVEDTSDVPILVGYMGSGHDSTYDEEQPKNRIPDRRNEYQSFPRNEYASIRPSYAGTPFSLGQIDLERSRFPTNGYYDPSNPTPLGLQDLPPLAIQLSKGNRRTNDIDNYRQDRVELQVPHFEHAYNKHYFGEEPPPHSLWYSKMNPHNPVAFRNVQTKWRPSFWNGRQNKYAFTEESNFVHANQPEFTPYSQSVPRMGYEHAGCVCRDQRNGLSYPYPSSSTNHEITLQDRDPGASIDDKLAPLN